ncbi:MAG: CatB-related O-acetyltransferase [Chitinophagaceae bacterium]|nr:CatB-related O-acetyltransferase [Chitinophagaceae bacterium]
MIAESANVKQSNIAETSNVHDFATVVQSELQGHNFIGKFSTLTYSKLGIYSYISQFSVVKSVTIGNFSSISWGCSLGPEEHDFNRLTTHSFLISTETFKLLEEKVYSPFDKPCTIGNDVWIGCGTTILRGVHIGDGAVVGANSVVTKSVPPFAIVAGSPARIIRFRFPKDIQDALIELAWWHWEEAKFKQALPLFKEKEVTQETIEALKKIKDGKF